MYGEKKINFQIHMHNYILLNFLGLIASDYA